MKKLGGLPNKLSDVMFLATQDMLEAFYTDNLMLRMYQWMQSKQGNDKPCSVCYAGSMLYKRGVNKNIDSGHELEKIVTKKDMKKYEALDMIRSGNALAAIKHFYPKLSNEQIEHFENIGFRNELTLSPLYIVWDLFPTLETHREILANKAAELINYAYCLKSVGL